MGLARSFFRLARPKQWTKNGFVLAGVVFAEKAFSASSVQSALIAFVAFCLLSGSVYAFNDVLDVDEGDRVGQQRGGVVRRYGRHRAWVPTAVARAATDARDEPPRRVRRLDLLRRWSHDTSFPAAVSAGVA